MKREGDPRARLRRAFGVPEEGARGVLRRHLARLERARVPVVLPEGEEIENARGRCWVRRLRYPGSVRHGRWSLAEARAVPFAKIAELARQPQLGGVALGDCLFLDTETTGLAGGAGTLVFLCGLGFADGEDLVLEQVFLRAFNEEAAALTFIAERLAQHPVPVTFVGKSFDRHRLAARMTLNRVPSTVLTERHLDLYYLARRAWRAALPDVRLRTVEERVLGLARVDDLPGERAPAAFLEWVRDRTGELERVFEHNRLDVLSLVALLVALGRGAAPGDG